MEMYIRAQLDVHSSIVLHRFIGKFTGSGYFTRHPVKINNSSCKPNLTNLFFAVHSTLATQYTRRAVHLLF